jgi:hypothetical protein
MTLPEKKFALIALGIFLGMSMVAPVMAQSPESPYVVSSRLLAGREKPGEEEADKSEETKAEEEERKGDAK